MSFESTDDYDHARLVNDPKTKQKLRLLRDRIVALDNWASETTDRMIAAARANDENALTEAQQAHLRAMKELHDAKFEEHDLLISLGIQHV
jgi:hypothetical protein